MNQIPLSLLALLALLPHQALPGADRPNLLLLYTDDESYRTLSCYPGSLPGVSTPHIDALAERG